MIDESYLKSVVKPFLPKHAEVTLFDSENIMIKYADIDGDNEKEIICIYGWNYHFYLMVLKNYEKAWHTIVNIKLGSNKVNYFYTVPVNNTNKCNIVMGIKETNQLNKLLILEFINNKIKHILLKDIYFSHLEVRDIESEKGKKGIYEMILWKHVHKEAYKIDVFRYRSGRLVHAFDTYPKYFKVISDYYRKLIEESPNESIYWYYYIRSQMKLKNTEATIKLINQALKLKKPYPSEEFLINLKKQLITQDRSYMLYPASVNTTKGVEWGYINHIGTFVIEPRFDEALEFKDNRAVVKVDDLYGVIDLTGDYLIKPEYDYINQFYEHRAIVILNNKYYVMNEEGKIITNKGYDLINNYSMERALFLEESDEGYFYYGYLDTNGEEVIQAQYLSGTDFTSNKAIVENQENKYQLITREGKIVETYDYPYVGELSCGLLVFQHKQTMKFGYIDQSGNIVIPPGFERATPFKNDRAVVNMSSDIKNKIGLIDRSGRFVIEPQYNEINQLGEGMVAVGKAINVEKPYLGSKYAIADILGNFYTDFIYSGVSQYNNGKASAYNDKYTFFINNKGKQIETLPKLEGSGILEIVNGIVRADVDYRISYYTPSGEVIWRRNKIIPLNRKISVRSHKYKLNQNYLVYYPQINGMQNILTEQLVNKKLKNLSQIKEVKTDINYTYYGDFEIVFFKKDLLVVNLFGYKYEFGAAHGLSTKEYVHIDLKTGSFYQLSDLFMQNSDYVKVLSEIIRNQIKTNELYQFVSLDVYKGISEDQPFYVTEDMLHIYFNPYEIASYAQGFVTFDIPFSEIDNLIDKNGEFWESFHYIA